MERVLRWSVVTLLGFGFVGGCAQLIGADDQRKERLTTSTLDASYDVFATVPEAGDPNACTPDQKRCNEACVAKNDPAYGCGSEECTPCSLSNAKTLECTPEGKCAAVTCRNGFAICGEPLKGCSADLSAPETCGECGKNCVGSFKPLCAPGGCEAACPGGTVQCGSSCVDTKTHPKNCGGCGVGCTPGANGDSTCVAGACRTECRPGFGHCDGNLNGPCVALTVFYPDADGDGTGNTKGPIKLACANQGGPGYVAKAGDCDDGNKEVYPGQQQYFTQAFKAPSGALSYDYDCNGVEMDRSPSTHFPGCNGSCAGAGIGPAGSGRTGAGVNDYCGSTISLSCSGGATAEQPEFGQQSLRPMAGGQQLEPACAVKSEPTGANPCR